MQIVRPVIVEPLLPELAAVKVYRATKNLLML
jgi:hypothetical protein